MTTSEASIINEKVIPNNVNDDLVNKKIRFEEVMMIGASEDKLGIRMRRGALKITYRQEPDLLCVAPEGQPSVCEVLDYGRYHFEQQKKAKETKKKQYITEVKPIRLSPVIDKHDFDIKMRHTRRWIESGMRVKVDMCFRGRLITRLEVGKKIINSFTEEISDTTIIEKRPILEGSTMSCILAPRKKQI